MSKNSVSLISYHHFYANSFALSHKMLIHQRKIGGRVYGIPEVLKNPEPVIFSDFRLHCIFLLIE